MKTTRITLGEVLQYDPDFEAEVDKIKDQGGVYISDKPSGDYGTVFLLNGKAVKVTTDSVELEHAQRLKGKKTNNFAGEIYNSSDELIGFYDNQVDNYKQDHYQFHWNEKINVNLNLSIGLNYTYGRGFYEEYNNNQTFNSLQLQDINIGGEKIIETDNVGQKWLENDNYITTLSLQYFTDRTKIILGGSYGKYIGDHFGKMVWAKFSSNALPNHEFYYNQGKKVMVIYTLK